MIITNKKKQDFILPSNTNKILFSKITFLRYLYLLYTNILQKARINKNQIIGGIYKWK